LLLKAQRIALSYWDCIKLSFAGNFLNFATPLGSNAGDVFKAYFLTTHTDRKTEAAATIFLDRLVGLATMLLAVSLIMMFSAGVRGLDELRPYVLTMLVVGVGGVLLYRSKTLRRHLVPWGMLQRLSFFDHLRRIDQSARELVSRKGIVVAAVFLSLLLQIVAMTGYFAAAVALGLTAHAGNILDYFVCFYTGSVVQALPGPPQGLGTVELVYRFLLADFGSASQIVSVAVAIRVTVLTAALPGLWVMLTGSYRPRASAAELVGSPAVGAATDPDRTPVVR
ncbi:MAG: YbhN family protein, partial [Phycisphaerae bacterium]